MKVNGDLVFEESNIGPKIYLANADVKGSFKWKAMNIAAKIKKDDGLDLRYAQIGNLEFVPPSANERLTTHLNIRGLVYNDLVGTENDQVAHELLAMIEKDGQYHPQPYEQLASVLRSNGNLENAQDVLMMKERARLKSDSSFFSSLPWRILGPLIGYGYRPWRAFWICCIVVLIGALVFHKADCNNMLLESGDRVVAFNAFVYSLDTFAPIIDLRQAKYRVPTSDRGAKLRDLRLGRFACRVGWWAILRNSPYFRRNVLLPCLQLRTGSLLSLYLWFHILCGWTLTTLLVIGLTGLIQG